jgi:hypothetical protein
MVTARAHVGGHGRDWRRHHAKSEAQNDSKFNRLIREAAAQARADLSRVNACFALFPRPFDPLEIARAVDDANNLHAMGGHAIQRQPALNDQRSRLFGDLRAHGAELGTPRESPTRFFDAIENVIRRGFRSLPGDVKPDIEQVLARAVSIANLAHGLAARRARASCFKAEKSTASASPLSTPSRQA